MTRGHGFYLGQLEKRIFSDIIKPLRKVDPVLADESVAASKLGEVKDLGVLVEEAQSQGVPLVQVKGGNAGMKAAADMLFQKIAERVIERTSDSG